MVEKNKKIKIAIPDCEYEGMFESEVVKSGTGGVIKAFKRFIGKEVIVLVKKDYDYSLDKKAMNKYCEAEQ